MDELPSKGKSKTVPKFNLYVIHTIAVVFSILINFYAKTWQNQKHFRHSYRSNTPSSGYTPPTVVVSNSRRGSSPLILLNRLAPPSCQPNSNHTSLVRHNSF